MKEKIGPFFAMNPNTGSIHYSEIEKTKESINRIMYKISYHFDNLIECNGFLTEC